MSAESKISIAMAVYNGERFIQEQLDSFVHQTRLPDELVVSDNASTDRTVEILRDFASQAPFPVRIFINDRNLGVSKNFERAIRECIGDIIFLSDCDDVWYSSKIARMEAAFEADPTVGVVICDADMVDGRLQPLGRTAWQNLGTRISVRQIQKIADGRARFLKQCFLTQGNCLAFRSRLRSVFMPLPSSEWFRKGWHDYFIAWSIVYSGAANPRAINTPLVAWRRHAQSISAMPEAKLFRRLSWRLAGFRQHPSKILLPVLQSVERARWDGGVVNPVIRSHALAHWRARCSLPRSRIRRVPIVLRELFTGRYSGFSRGALTAAKDLLLVRSDI